MTSCRKLVLWLWFLAVYSKATTSRGLEISCISNERKVKFKQLDSDAGNSSLMFALNGSTLICSCTRNNSGLLTGQHLAWAINGKHFNQTWQNNYTVNITVPVIDWNYNKTVFECKVINANQTIKHKQFLLIVGDRPGPPMNLQVDSFYQRPRFTWTASRFTGNLQPSIYTVRFSTGYQDLRHCNNFAAPCLRIEVSSQEEFVHVPGKKYSCILQTQNYMTCIYNSLPQPYKVWVAAKNEVGSSNSSNVLEIQPVDFAYANSSIHAPENISVTDITDTGFKVSFRKGKLWVIDDMGPFADHYSTKLKLAVIGNSARQIVKYDNISLKGNIISVEDLTPWTLYSICLQVQIVSGRYHESTAFSPSKCSVVRTKQARPSIPPTITSCNFTVSSNGSMVLKNISWSIPPNDSWNSPWLEGFRLIYLVRDEVPEVQKKNVVILGNSSTSYELSVPFFATVDVWIESCNAAGLCSHTSDKCRILPLVLESGPVFDNNGALITAIIITGGILVLLLIIIIPYILFRRHRQRQNPLLDMFKNMELTPDQYDRIYTEGQQQENHVYDE